MNTNGRKDLLKPFCQGQHSPAILQIKRRNDNPFDTGGDGPFDYRFPVIVKTVEIEMAVSINQHYFGGG
jgi:hypothetical protein